MTASPNVSLNEEDRKATIIALEKQALELWNKGNPDGFIELSSQNVVYADPALRNKLEGKQALEEYYDKMRGKIKVDSYKMIEPRVWLSGEIAVLTYDYEVERENRIVRMHCTEVYKTDSLDRWKITHTHWSFVLPTF